jgi:chemotaxis protein CheX
MYQQELGEIAKVIWDSVLQLPLENAAAEVEARGREAITVGVDVTGAWHGTITATVTTALGTRIAAAMLQTAPESLEVADVSDSLLEVVNILGGNFKALLPEGCRLCLPRIVSVPDAALGTLESAASFVCEEQPLHIEVHSRAIAS